MGDRARFRVFGVTRVVIVESGRVSGALGSKGGRISVKRGIFGSLGLDLSANFGGVASQT